MIPKTQWFIIILLTITPLFTHNILAQKEGSVWYFGNGETLNFNQGCELSESSTSNAMYAPEGSAIISDENGTVLFYTNGGGRDPNVTGENPGYIWNREHDVMYDMMGMEGGGWSAVQSSVILPKPNISDQYYLFTMDELEANIDGNLSRGLSYFEIDMTLNGGLGGVSNYQESVVLKGTEFLAACQHQNQIDSWVAVYNEASQGFNILSVNSNGVNFESAIDTFALGSIYYGTIRFAPNQSKILVGRGLFDFDNSTGVLSNEIYMGDQLFNSATFSPNSRYLYIIRPNLNSNDFIRYDMQAADILNSEELIASLDGNSLMTSLQLAPDGNLYFLENNLAANTSQLSSILCANSFSPCLQQGVSVLSTNSIISTQLPNFTDHFFASDLLENPMEVCVDATLFEICPGEEVTLSANHYLGDSFMWSNGGTNATNIIDQPGIYTVTVSDACCNSGTAEIEIMSAVPGPLGVEIIGENTICENQTITLTANASFEDFIEWSTGSTSNEIEINATGTYSLTATNICGETVSDEITITYTNPLELDFDFVDLLPCSGEVELSLVSDATSFQWSTGETTSSIFVNAIGTYQVAVNNGCVSGVDSVEVFPQPINDILIPNAFTPDGDGVNDFFGVEVNCNELMSFEIKIYNRWGQLVFEGNDPSMQWDGTFEEQPMTSDVLVYFVNYVLSNGEVVQDHGDVTLIR